MAACCTVSKGILVCGGVVAGMIGYALVKGLSVDHGPAGRDFPGIVEGRVVEPVVRSMTLMNNVGSSATGASQIGLVRADVPVIGADGSMSEMAEVALTLLTAEPVAATSDCEAWRLMFDIRNVSGRGIANILLRLELADGDDWIDLGPLQSGPLRAGASGPVIKIVECAPCAFTPNRLRARMLTEDELDAMP